MRKYTLFLFLILCFLGCRKEPSDNPGNTNLPAAPTLETSEKQLIVTDQKYSTIRIYDQPTRLMLWKWTPSDSKELSETQQGWLSQVDECKPVMDGSCILLTASGSKGGAGLVRIKDKKMLFVAQPKNNPHSAELLPDGYVVVACSDGKLFSYKLDDVTPYVSTATATFNFPGAHGVLWDKKRNCLWAIGDAEMLKFSVSAGVLTVMDRVTLPTMYGHDLVPQYDEDKIICTTPSNVYWFDPESMKFSEVESVSQRGNVKSVSSGPEGFTTICTYPVESWWTNQVTGLYTGLRVFYNADIEIYKARWRVDNNFSY